MPWLLVAGFFVLFRPNSFFLFALRCGMDVVAENDAMMQRFAPHRAALSGVLGGCLYSAWRFQSTRRAAGLAPRAACAGVACAAISWSMSSFRAWQVRRHRDALERLQRTADAVHMLPIGDGSALPIPAREFDDATGEVAKDINAELLRQVRREEREQQRLQRG
eukprot:TRINITY_DN12569_c0_g1_i1.p3 TRINITY_DN12569_c0_g1~~TRINITY_DN12569_c0_g1_i1.p3  ORF type:complete len:164 (-),score=32.07 TRINITY_DN12569_c0_g1_i1:67-558(-)